MNIENGKEINDTLKVLNRTIFLSQVDAYLANKSRDEIITVLKESKALKFIIFELKRQRNLHQSFKGNLRAEVNKKRELQKQLTIAKNELCPNCHDTFRSPQQLIANDHIAEPDQLVTRIEVSE